MTTPISPDVPTDILEQQAAEQRRRIHNTVSELRTQVKSTVREKLDVRRHAREYVWPASAAVAILGLLFGYGTAGTVKHMVS
ncbi:MAG TPA: hypothetical protein VN577_14455 [Terriglobales bacterium]|nr:hypothetical protein [Terriglobales bacterium]